MIFELGCLLFNTYIIFELLKGCFSLFTYRLYCTIRVNITGTNNVIAINLLTVFIVREQLRNVILLDVVDQLSDGTFALLLQRKIAGEGLWWKNSFKCSYEIYVTNGNKDLKQLDFEYIKAQSVFYFRKKSDFTSIMFLN